MNKLNPFDFVRSINEKTGNMMEISPDAERDYVPFVVNRGFSFGSDTILYANEMNIRPNTDKRMQYDYLYNSVRRRKRFDKWIKANAENDGVVEALMEYYKVSRKRATEYFRLLSKERLASILKSRGGSNAK
jgi:hypothetical protein